MKSQHLIENKLENEFWYKKNFKRDESEIFLQEKSFGVFIVRKSETVKNSYVLTVKVPYYINKNTVSHYLITRKNKKFVLEGVDRQFLNLNHLVTYFSLLRDTLPVMLNLDFEQQQLSVDRFCFI